MSVKLYYTKYGTNVTSPSGSYFIDRDGNTLLLWLLHNKYYDEAINIISLGVELGVECHPEHFNQVGDTALLYACRHKISNVAIHLIRSGFDCRITKCDSEGRSAFFWACYNNLFDVASELGRYYPEACNLSETDKYGHNPLNLSYERHGEFKGLFSSIRSNIFLNDSILDEHTEFC
jgi:ankyrin repeat protein